MRAVSVDIAVLWLMIESFGWALTRDEENNLLPPLPTDSLGSGIISGSHPLKSSCVTYASVSPVV